MVSRWHPSSPGFRELPLRSRIAWWFRLAADRLDAGRSYNLTGMWPAHMGDQDIFDAMCFGGTAMQAYMTDLQCERRSERAGGGDSPD